MNWLLVISALAGFGSAIGHSYLSERFVLRPLFAARGENRILANASTRRLLRWVWHLPSFAWAQIAGATLWLAIYPQTMDNTARTFLLYFGVGVYMTAAFFNLFALRRPHVGNILLTLAALTLWLGLR